MDYYLKVLSDLDCSLFIDGEFIQNITADTVTKIPLRKGEYIIECCSLLDSTIKQIEEILLEYDRLYKVTLLDSILNNLKSWDKLVLLPQKNKDELYGYYLKGTTKCIIPHKYKEAGAFISHCAVVSNGETRAVIGKNGKYCIPLGMFSNIVIDGDDNEIFGFFVYQQEYLGWGYCNRYGQLIANCIYGECTRYDRYLLCKCENREERDVLYDLDGGGEQVFCANEIEVISDPREPGHLPLLFFIHINGQFGILDDKLEAVVPIEYSSYDCESNDPYDSEQNRFIKYIFRNDRISKTRCDLWKPHEVRRINGKTYYVYFNNNITELRVASLTFYRNRYYGYGKNARNVAILWHSQYSYSSKKNGQRNKELTERTIAIIQSDGKKIINAETIDDFYNDYAKVSNKGKLTFIDLEGNFLTDFKYVSLGHFFDGVAIVSNGKGWGVINSKGEEMIPCKYKSIRSAEDKKGVLIASDSSGKETHFNKEGNELL